MHKTVVFTAAVVIETSAPLSKVFDPQTNLAPMYTGREVESFIFPLTYFLLGFAFGRSLTHFDIATRFVCIWRVIEDDTTGGRSVITMMVHHSVFKPSTLHMLAEYF